MGIAINTLSAGALESIPQRIDAIVARNPEGIAVRCGDLVATYRELLERTLQAEAQLRRRGCAAGDRIAILAENHPHYIAAFIAIVRMGACAVTLPTMLPSAALAQMIEDSCSKCLITSWHCGALARDVRIRAPAAQITLLSLDDADPTAPTLFSRDGQSTSALRTPPFADLAAEFNVVYSSGTTGNPKGIVHSHRTRATLAAGFEGLGLNGSAVTLVSTPLYTNMSIPAILATLWGGGTVDVIDRFEPQQFLDRASSVRATHFFLVPTQVERLLGQPDFVERDLRATRLKYVAGSKLRVELKARLLAEWPGELVEVYAMTEGAPFTALFASRHPDKLASVGCAPPGVSIRIIDDQGRPAAIGTLGEILGRSGTMMMGYNRRPEETEALIWRDVDGGQFFRSGDIGRLDEDGFLYVVDRKKDIIISGGYNIYSADLEEVVLQHPQVAEAAVTGIESVRWGESPVAFVVMKRGATAVADELRVWVNERLGKYQRLARVELCAELPRNALGKVVKRALRLGFPPLP